MLYSDDIRASYRGLWDSMLIHPFAFERATVIAQTIINGKARYQVVEKATGVPWWFTGVIHSMEADCSFRCHLHNGDPLSARTVHEPKGRPIDGSPPFPWEVSAEDALRCEGLSTWKDWSIPGALYRLEAYNGWGYRHHGVWTPYLWSGSNHYDAGKYIADGEWDADAVSDQIGAAALLRKLLDLKAFTFDKGAA